MIYKGNKMFLCCAMEKKPPPQTMTCIPSGTVAHSTKTKAAVRSAYLHPQEVFFVLHNRSRLNSLMCQHLLQFLLQSKLKGNVVSKKKKLKNHSPLIYLGLLNNFKWFTQRILKWPRWVDKTEASNNSYRNFVNVFKEICAHTSTTTLPVFSLSFDKETPVLQTLKPAFPFLPIHKTFTIPSQNTAVSHGGPDGQNYFKP